MLKIRLARHGRKKAPFYRIVLTEHTKPTQSGYKLVLGRFNPLSHSMEMNIEEIKLWISKGAKPSERVAKLLFAETKDKMFKEYFVERERTKGKPQEENKSEVKKEQKDIKETKEEVKEETKEEVKEETKEEVKEETKEDNKEKKEE